ncbi:hypothetical protein M2651_01950 [Clostridium sp. SYSU_GA19001]|uniref:hypothetical protein n=1 Tax=Clostridium caldaquaticum TaxID=2940653 RepID=UPI0020774033|nr:hypothetical protein [Clostridium caldaquaticum]MCM8709784.1 hypothetical protein [Clostridium caldaquaticum]
MSRKHCKKDYDCFEKHTLLGGLGNCCCDFPTLIILILIILQFNRKGGYYAGAQVAVSDDGCGSAPVVAPSLLGGTNLIDNSILFIIALYFLSCCTPCRK